MDKAALFLSAALCALAAPSAHSEDEKFVAVDCFAQCGEDRGVHFAIDGNVNVRAEPSLSGRKLFRLDAGERVRITEYSEGWEWVFADGLWAPWYRISCGKGEGFVCARYISSKQAAFDIDLDGRDEIFACLTVSGSKGTPISEYKLSSGNMDDKFVIIKDGKISPVDFGETDFVTGFRDADYRFVRGEGLSPAVCFLVVGTGFGDAGSSWGKDRYYYFLGGRPRLFLNLENGGDVNVCWRCESLEFPGNNVVRHVNKSEHWQDWETSYRTGRWTDYAWDGENFTLVDSGDLSDDADWDK